MAELEIEDLSFAEICNRVEALLAQNGRAEQDLEVANKHAERHKKEISDLKKQNAELKKQNQNLTTRLNKIDQQLSNLKKANRGRQSEVKKEELSLNQEEEIIQNHIILRTSRPPKTSSTPSISTSLEILAQLPSHPFVVMLVDGDSYRVSQFLILVTLANSSKFTDILTKSKPDPGVTLAQALRVDISKYILLNSHIPAHSRIVVRIFFNGRHTLGPRRTSNARQYTKMEETMVRFAETQPLFDFIDCGGGKERADDKIRGTEALIEKENSIADCLIENGHLYLGCTDCHALFLAVCKDNGYARFLERYQENPVAKQKIVLVEAGAMAEEIKALKFKATSFPRVFLSTGFTINKKKGSRPQILKAATGEGDNTEISEKHQSVQLTQITPQSVADLTILSPPNPCILEANTSFSRNTACDLEIEPGRKTISQAHEDSLTAVEVQKRDRDFGWITTSKDKVRSQQGILPTTFHETPLALFPFKYSKDGHTTQSQSMVTELGEPSDVD